jgi:hypothetical protein
VVGSKRAAVNRVEFFAAVRASECIILGLIGVESKSNQINSVCLAEFVCIDKCAVLVYNNLKVFQAID